MPKKKGGNKEDKKKEKKEKKFDASGYTSGREALLSYKLINRRQQLDTLQQEYTESRLAKDDTWKCLDKAKVDRQTAFEKFMCEFQRYKERYESEEQVGHENVLAAIHSNIDFIHNSKAEIKELEERICNTGREKEELFEKVLSGRHFKEVVMGENQEYIEELNDEFVRMDQEYEATRVELEKAFLVMKSTIEEQTERQIGDQKHVVSDQVLTAAVTDNQLLVKETKENAWFKQEIAWYQRQIAELQASNGELEARNLDLISGLSYGTYSTYKSQDLAVSASPRRKLSPKPHTSIPSVPSLPDIDGKTSPTGPQLWPVTLSMLQSIKLL